MSGQAVSLEREWAQVRADLATARLDLPQIYSAGQRLNELASAALDGDAPNLTVRRVAIVGSLTSDFLAKAISCAAAQEGELGFIYQAPFGAYRQDILDPCSGLHRFRPEVIVVAPDWRTEVEEFQIGAPVESVDKTIAEKVDGFRRLWDAISSNSQVRIIQHTLAPPTWHLRGTAERLWRGSYENQVIALNNGMFEAGRGRVTWVEIDRLAARVGLENWSDEGAYFSSKLPFRLKYLADYVLAFRAAWRGASARAKKVLVLDLDNTLWGGVIGDAGVEGIVLGPGSPTGEAFQNWGLYVRRLRARGVILAVCSKNNPEVAATAFDHAHFVLERDDFAAFECSWGDKASGLKRIAEQIGVGIDSLVFADDNPAECEQVRTALPEVGVVHLGADPTRFIALLDRGQWFDHSQYTPEDLARGSAYVARAMAKREEAVSGDFSTFLAGLQMVGSVGEADSADLARLAQLELKTNQFNLTTRRYAEADIAGFIERSDVAILSVRLADKFGDHGLVSSLIAIANEDTLRIDSWLMSCRVFSRTLEQFTMHYLTEVARRRGSRRIVGEYLPTTKNSVVSDLYDRLGFAPQGDGANLWVLELGEERTLPAMPTWIVSDVKEGERDAAE